MAAIIYVSNWRIATFSATALIAFVLLLTWLGRHLLAGKNQEAVLASSMIASAQLATSKTSPDLGKQTVLQTLSTLLSKPALWGLFYFCMHFYSPVICAKLHHTHAGKCVRH